MNKGIEDLFYFGRIISAALVICGYVILGVIIGKKLVENGYPHWVLLLSAFSGATFGLWQGWVLIKKILKR